MQFEILNTIKYLVYVIVMGVIYWKLKNIKVVKTSWKAFFVVMLVITLITYNQFFTLTESADIKATQRIMSEQSSQISNGRLLNQYLKDNTPVLVDSEAEREAELVKQKQKSKEIADKIDAIKKENNEEL
jgi:thiol:disulfide interchange protein